MTRKAGLLLIISAVALIFNGCNLIGTEKTKTEWKPADPVSKPPYVHTVKYPGETLRIISKWYTGDADNWEALVDANPYIAHEKMTAGTRVFIPENLLKKTEPLSEEYIAACNQESKPVQESKPIVKEEKKARVKPKPQPKKDEDFDLIGPK